MDSKSFWPIYERTRHKLVPTIISETLRVGCYNTQYLCVDASLIFDLLEILCHRRKFAIPTVVGCIDSFGTLQAFTVAAAVSSFKPLMNASNLGIFVMLHSRHTVRLFVPSLICFQLLLRQFSKCARFTRRRMNWTTPLYGPLFRVLSILGVAGYYIHRSCFCENTRVLQKY